MVEKIVVKVVVFRVGLWLHLKSKLTTLYGLLRPGKRKLKNAGIDHRELLDDMWRYAMTKDMPIIIIDNEIYHELIRMDDFSPVHMGRPDLVQDNVIGLYKGVPVMVSSVISMRPGYYVVSQ